MDILKNFFGKKPDYSELLANGATVVDVRTPGEYKSGHFAGSKNIPLDQLSAKVEQVKELPQPIITVCRSGSRSAMALSILKSAGVEAYNGGAWNSLK